MELRNDAFLEDELFCLKFELKALADLTIRHEAERWVPEFIWKDNEWEHTSRYELASKYVENKTVLDAACGSGYGSYLLATRGKAASVTSYDLDRDAIRYGNIRYAHEGVKRSERNVLDLLPPNTFDVIVSFETIEHLDQYEQFIQNVFKALKSGGTLLISTPVVENTHTNCINPYHRIEWSFEDFQKLIQGYFTIKETYVQGLVYKQPQKNIFQRILGRAKRIINPDNTPPVVKKTDTTPQQYEHCPLPIIEGYQIIICIKQ